MFTGRRTRAWGARWRSSWYPTATWPRPLAAGARRPEWGTAGRSGRATALGTLSHRRFLREAQSASSLNHPNICTIYDIGEQAGGPYLVMELLRGETLKEALWHGPLSVTDVVAYSRQVAAALAAAHAQGIVHRDIKPANIFVHEGARGVKQIKVLDFGLAKKQGDDLQDDDGLCRSGAQRRRRYPADLTVAGVTPGTAAYMSPEQAKGEPLDARTDLFSLGVVIYEMATGSKPFGPLLTKEPGPVSAVNRAMPAELDGIVARLLAKEKEQRYQTAEELLQDLERLDAQISHASSGGEWLLRVGRIRPVQDLPSAEKARGPPPAAAAGRRGVILLLAGAFAWWKHRLAVTPGTATAPATASAPGGGEECHHCGGLCEPDRRPGLSDNPEPGVGGTARAVSGTGYCELAASAAEPAVSG